MLLSGEVINAFRSHEIGAFLGLLFLVGLQLLKVPLSLSEPVDQNDCQSDHPEDSQYPEHNGEGKDVLGETDFACLAHSVLTATLRADLVARTALTQLAERLVRVAIGVGFLAIEP